MDRSYSFNREEIAPVIVVSLISALRLLGIFLMLPIFSAYAVRYPGASVALAGVHSGFTRLPSAYFKFLWAGPAIAGAENRYWLRGSRFSHWVVSLARTRPTSIT
jgi:hypothetical protein